VTISLVTRFEEDGNDSKLLFQIKNDNSKNVTITDINFVSGKNYDFIIAMKDILRQSNNEIPMTIQRHDQVCSIKMKLWAINSFFGYFVEKYI